MPLQHDFGVADGFGCPLFQDRGPESVFQQQGGSQSSASPGKVYSRREESPAASCTSDSREKCGFRSGHGTLDKLYILARVLEGVWELASYQSTCVLWIWRRLMTTSLKVSSVGCSESMR